MRTKISLIFVFNPLALPGTAWCINLLGVVVLEALWGKLFQRFWVLDRYFGVIVPLVSVMLCHKKRMTSRPKLLNYLSFLHFVFPQRFAG